VVLITGGSRGLGVGLARALAKKGARLAICGRDGQELRAAETEIRRFSNDVISIPCDVADSSQVENLVNAALDRFGRIDVLINNAGVIEVGPFHTMTVADFENAMKVIFWGTVYTTLAVLPHMLQRGEGRIVNVTSVGGKVSVPHLLPYSCAKFAAVAFSEGLRSELRGTGVTTTTVAPGLMRTGSFLNSRFKGDNEHEAAWFSISASLPGVSMSAQRAVDQILQAAARGQAEKVLSVPAQLLALFHGIFPGLTAEHAGYRKRHAAQGTGHPQPDHGAADSQYEMAQRAHHPGAAGSRGLPPAVWQAPTRMTGCGLRVEVIASDERLCQFEEEWRAFQRILAPATPFQTPDWLMSWWSHFGSGTLRVFVFRDGARVAGIVPCFLRCWKDRRQLTLIGSGLSDYLGPPLADGYSEKIIAVLQSELAAFSDWDICDWQDLSDDTPLQRLGPSREDLPCTELEMGTSFEHFLESRPAYLRRNLRHGQERSAIVGDVQFDVCRYANPELLTCLVDQHGARWRDSGQSGMIESNHAGAFLREVAAAMAGRDLLRIFSLRFDRQVVATILALRDESRIFGYLSAFHPGYRKYGFGHELLCRSLRYAHEQGCRWGFLRGDEQYKLDWGARMIPKRRVTIER